MPSTSLRQFLDDLNAGGDPRSVTYRLDLFRALEGTERAQAIALLVRGGQAKDRRAVETLGQGGAIEALDDLRTLSQVDGDLGTVAARAVASLVASAGEGAQDDTAVRRIADGVVGRNPLESAMSAYALRFLDGEEAIRGLLTALTSPNSAARANACLGLKKKLDLEPLLTPRQSPLYAPMMTIMSRLESIWQPAAAQLKEWLDGLVAGQSLSDLGLVYERASDPGDIQAFWNAATAREGYDIAAFSKLSGHDRDWAVAYMLSELWLRPASAVVLAELEIDGLEAILAEAVKRSFFENKEMFQAGLDALRARS